MLTYLVTIPTDALTPAQKTAVTAAIGAANGARATAHGEKVEVKISETDAGCFFMGGRLLDCGHIFVHGTVREGSQPEDRAALAADLVERISKAADFDPENVVIYVSEMPGKN